MKLWLDLETRSPVPIRHGVAKYARNAQVIVLSWALDDGPIHVEDLSDGLNPSDEFYDALQLATEIWAHNAQFDRTVLDHQSWWPSTPIEQWRCTAALARMHGLPGGLDLLCRIFKVGDNEAKLASGKRLIHLFCVPRRDGTYGSPGAHPVEWAEFLKYAGRTLPPCALSTKECRGGAYPRACGKPGIWTSA